MVRVKDMVAWQLSKIGFPKFQPDWPESERDRAANNIAEFLNLHEKDLHAFPDRMQDMVCNEVKVSLNR